MSDDNPTSKSQSQDGEQAQTRLPTQAELDKVAQVEMLDKNGDKKQFGTLWSRHGDMPRRTIVVFIRHFNCEVRKLIMSTNASDVAVNTDQPC
jgi:hypothetical protein